MYVGFSLCMQMNNSKNALSFGIFAFWVMRKTEITSIAYLSGRKYTIGFVVNVIFHFAVGWFQTLSTVTNWNFQTWFKFLISFASTIYRIDNKLQSLYSCTLLIRADWQLSEIEWLNGILLPFAPNPHKLLAKQQVN